jgi:DNA-directed RNA polymerase subunit RPC12/RpoP
MVMPSKYRCSSCNIEFTDSDAVDFPILCETCKVLKEFSDKIKKESKDLPPEFSKFIDKHFWELI